MVPALGAGAAIPTVRCFGPMLLGGPAPPPWRGAALLTDERGRWHFRWRCRAVGVCVAAVVGGDGQSGAVPRACLPGRGSLAVRAGGAPRGRTVARVRGGCRGRAAPGMSRTGCVKGGTAIVRGEITTIGGLKR